MSGEWTRELRLEFAKGYALEWRGIEGEPCSVCSGSGVRNYGSTSTWRGGIGGQAFTADVCDGCWGSGDAKRPWTNLRKLRDEERARIAKAAGELLARRLGVSFDHCRDGLLELGGELERLSRGRKKRPHYFAESCAQLAKTIREMVGQ